MAPNRKSNPIWDYFDLKGDRATCQICKKTLAYKNHMYLTSLSNHLASKRYGHNLHYLEYISKKNEMNRESDFINNMFAQYRKGQEAGNSFFPNFEH